MVLIFDKFLDAFFDTRLQFLHLMVTQSYNILKIVLNEYKDTILERINYNLYQFILVRNDSGLGSGQYHQKVCYNDQSISYKTMWDSNWLKVKIL